MISSCWRIATNDLRSTTVDLFMYISLHNRTAYSFGSALTTSGQLVAFAAEHNMPAIAITDLDGLYAAVPFQQACEKAGIRPIFGAELSLAEGAAVTLLAQNDEGYGNLCRLVSTRYLGDALLSVENLRDHAKGLICLLGHMRDAFCTADRNAPPRSDNATSHDPSPCIATCPTRLHQTAHRLREIFTQDLYLELSIHDPSDLPTARRRARIADELGVPVVATCESRCLRRDQALLLTALSSVGTLTLLDQPHSDKPIGAWHLRTPEEMQRLFARRPDAITNTLRIADMCHASLELSQSRFPSFDSPDGRPAIQHLRTLSVAGCRRRYVEQPPLLNIGGKRPTLAEALERLERELSIIEQVHYAEYFLVFHEIVEYCRSEGISFLARGSAADSLVCYVLGVSHACPFRFDLPFDRFINPERAKFSKMADIDLDLPWDQRDQVIRWVYDRWGHDRVAMIGASNTFRARAAVAELGKVYGLPAHEVHRATKLLSRMAYWKGSSALAQSPEAHEVPTDEEPYRTILKMARDLEGLPRHWMMHPCGLVVSPKPLTDLVPVQRSPKGSLVAQYDMDAIEDLGFVKVDLLGQAGLSVLRDTVAEINLPTSDKQQPQMPVNLDTDVDYADPATWELIASGNARGVHHIESPAMTSLIQQCNCHDIDCLTTIVAIIRPGAANQGKKEAFARRHQGLEPTRYAHPAMEPALKKTYGLMVFEEHILQVATEFADMNLGRADVLRRALNKQNLPLVAELKSEFYASALLHGRPPREAELIWPLLEGFSGFMFNKAHSAEYAVEAFQGAWLKRRWPAHYIAAILSNYRGFYAHSPTLPQILYVMEALRLGITFKPPCVNESRDRFSVEGPPTAIRVPVSHISGVSQAFIHRYLAERERSPFLSLEDFVQRCEPGEAETHTLLDSGALDCLGESRPAMFWQLRDLQRHANNSCTTLWGVSPRSTKDKPAPPVSLTEPDIHQIAEREMALLGFPITIDPLAYLGLDDKGRQIDWPRYVPVDKLADHLGKRVTVCGLMVADRLNATTKGDVMKFVTLADRTGFVEAVLFPPAYRRFGHLTIANPILTATGWVEPFENRNGFTLRVQSITIPARSKTAATTSIQNPKGKNCRRRESNPHSLAGTGF